MYNSSVHNNSKETLKIPFFQIIEDLSHKFRQQFISLKWCNLLNSKKEILECMKYVPEFLCQYLPKDEFNYKRKNSQYETPSSYYLKLFSHKRHFGQRIYSNQLTKNHHESKEFIEKSPPYRSEAKSKNNRQNYYYQGKPCHCPWLQYSFHYLENLNS